MTSTFHPQLFRGSGPSSSSSSPPPPSNNRSSTAASTSTSAVRHATSATANTPLPTSSSKSSTSTSNDNNNNEYIHGLQANPLDYPAHPSFISSSSSRHASSSSPYSSISSTNEQECEEDIDDDECRVRLISAAQYANLVYNHSNIKLQSENVLFPWLHGADIPYSAQAENFGLRDGQYQCVPRYRGLFTIAAHAPRANDVEGEEEEEEAQAHESSSNNVSLHSSSHRHTASSSGSSSCDSVFLDPTCREESMLSGSPAPMAVEDEEDVTLSASSSSAASCADSPSQAHSNSEDAAQATTTSNPHVRNPTSASIATSYSTDSFCSSAHASSSSSSSSSYSASSYSISRTSSSAASSLLNSGLASSASSIHSASFLLCGDDALSRKDTRESSQRRQGSIVEEDDDNDDGVVHCESRGRGHDHDHGVEEGMRNASRGATSTCLAQGDCSEKNTSNVRNDNTVNNGKNATLSMVQPDRKKKKIPFGPEEYASLLVNSHHPHEVLAYEACAELDRIQRRKEEKRRAAAMHSSSNNNNNNVANQESQITQHDVIEDDEDDDSRFVCFQSHPIPTNTVSFRHFRLQRYKYLTISDLVIYHPKGGLHFDAVDIARKVDVAQRKMERVRWERGERHAVRYHVYVVLEPFHVFEEKFPHLVAVDSRAWPTSNKISFSDKEHEESQALTKASEIGENVFLGNSFDVPIAQNEEEVNALHSDVSSNFSFALRRSPSLSSISSSTPSILNTPDFYAQTQESQQGKFKSDSNPDQYAICIEARDMAAMCSTRNLRERERYLDELQMQIERERDIEAARTTRCGAKSIPASLAHVTSTNQQKKTKSKTNSGARKRSSAFWFSSGSSSEEEEEGYESTSESSDDGDTYQVKETEIIVEEDTSDFEDFAEEEKELELLHDAPYGTRHGQSIDADVTLSPGRFSMALDTEMPPSSVASRASLAQASGRCVSPPPYGFNGASTSASSHSTPIKLQYKKSKSLNKARELEIAKAKDEAESKARSKAMAVSERDLTKPREILKVSSEEIVYMECLSTAQSNQASMPAMVDAIVEYVVWLRTQARPHLRTSRDLQRACAANYQHQQAKYPHQQPYGSASSAERYLPQAQLGTMEKPFVPMARRVLIHCLDGYTDSSILALSYIMYDRAISLPQAYLYLQNECKRSFFVYSSDVAFLQAIEKRVQLVVQSQGRDKFNDDLSEEEQQARLEAERVARDAEIAASIAASMAAVSPQGAGSSKGLASATRERAKSLIPRPGLFSRSSSKDSTGSCATVKASQVSFSTPATPAPSSLPRGPLPAPRPASAAPAMSLSPSSALQQKEDTNAVSDAWFHSEHFDGHFPSRILDYLYLGNLSHASNALMLKELGITHVLSIGESALVPPSKQCAPSSPSSAARARTPTNSLWLEHSLGNITVMDVQDINDDGVDSILPHLMAGMQFIDSARAAGGKCLVHCRVGVSRSATVVIGQIMKDLDISLAEAYLLVRARRLNILIQPTILFMHTLWTWEEQIRNLNKKQLKSFEENENYPAFEKSGRICWPVLATEIADLNFKYLNC